MPPNFFMRHNLQHIEKHLNAKDYAKARTAIAGLKDAPRALKLSLEGVVRLKEGRYADAEAMFLASLQDDPNLVLSNGNYAHLLVLTKRQKIALPYAEKAHTADPKNRNFALNYAAALSDADRPADAVKVLEPFTSDPSADIKLLITYASLLRADLRLKDSLDVLERVRASWPDSEEILKTYADTLSELDPQAASAAFHAASEKLGPNASLEWNWSFVELRRKNFPLAWRLYDNGLTEKIGKVGRPLPSILSRYRYVTDFSDLDPHKWTFFVSEQGLGDQILFLTCLREAIERFPKSVLIGEERMLPILRRSFPEIGVYPYATARTFDGYTPHLNPLFPIGSLPKNLRQSEPDFKKAVFPLLKVNEAQVENYRKRLSHVIRDKKLVGLSWSGGFWTRQLRTKSVSFEDLIDSLPTEGVHYICLQYGDVSKEKELARGKKFPISFISGIDFKKDLDGWMSVTALCDEILSVSTALVHFAAAIGRPVRLMLTNYQTPFVWALDEGQSYVYPAVTIHRQRKEEPVSSLIRRASAGLKDAI